MPDSDIGIIIQARSGSTRLPDKMVLPFYHNEGILELLLDRLNSSIKQVPVVLATSENPKDDKIENIARKKKIEVFRGDEDNVLSRFIQAATKYGFKKVIRICADNPFLDMRALQELITAYCKELDIDYFAYYKKDLTPTIKTHYGFWTEGVSVKALQAIQQATTEKLYTEHITAYIYNFPEKFSIKYTLIDPYIDSFNNIRLTIDNREDFDLSQKIYSFLIDKKVPFFAGEICREIESHPDWLKIMENQIHSNFK